MQENYTLEWTYQQMGPPLGSGAWQTFSAADSAQLTRQLNENKKLGVLENWSGNCDLKVDFESLTMYLEVPDKKIQQAVRVLQIPSSLGSSQSRGGYYVLTDASTLKETSNPNKTASEPVSPTATSSASGGFTNRTLEPPLASTAVDSSQSEDLEEQVADAGSASFNSGQLSFNGPASIPEEQKPIPTIDHSAAAEDLISSVIRTYEEDDFAGEARSTPSQRLSTPDLPLRTSLPTHAVPDLNVLSFDAHRPQASILSFGSIIVVPDSSGVDSFTTPLAPPPDIAASQSTSSSLGASQPLGLNSSAGSAGDASEFVRPFSGSPALTSSRDSSPSLSNSQQGDDARASKRRTLGPRSVSYAPARLSGTDLTSEAVAIVPIAPLEPSSLTASEEDPNPPNSPPLVENPAETTSPALVDTKRPLPSPNAAQSGTAKGNIKIPTGAPKKVKLSGAKPAGAKKSSTTSQPTDAIPAPSSPSSASSSSIDTSARAPVSNLRGIFEAKAKK